MSKKETLIQYLKSNNGIITHKDCQQLGIPTVYLTRLEDEGLIYRIEKGIYLSSDGDYDEYFFFQYRFTKAIFSYLSALYLHGLTDEIPQYFEVSVTRGYRFNKQPPNLTIHYTSKEINQLGIEIVETPFGNPVYVYNVERVICDYIKNRHKIDNELFVKTLQRYSQYPKKNIARLYDYASKMNIIEETKRTLEVLI